MPAEVFPSVCVQVARHARLHILMLSDPPQTGWSPWHPHTLLTQTTSVTAVSPRRAEYHALCTCIPFTFLLLYHLALDACGCQLLRWRRCRHGARCCVALLLQCQHHLLLHQHKAAAALADAATAAAWIRPMSTAGGAGEDSHYGPLPVPCACHSCRHWQQQTRGSSQEEWQHICCWMTKFPCRSQDGWAGPWAVANLMSPEVSYTDADTLDTRRRRASASTTLQQEAAQAPTTPSSSVAHLQPSSAWQHRPLLLPPARTPPPPVLPPAPASAPAQQHVAPRRPHRATPRAAAPAATAAAHASCTCSSSSRRSRRGVGVRCVLTCNAARRHSPCHRQALLLCCATAQAQG